MGEGGVFADVQGVRVQVLSAHESSVYRCRVAVVQALHGTPFFEYSHGGWCQTDCITVPVRALQNVTVPVVEQVSYV